MTLEIGGLTAGYSSRSAAAISDVTLNVESATTLAIVGPSGAGKTTLLRTIGGLLRARGGDVRVNGKSVVKLPPQERRIAMVFQDDALLPHLTLRKNLQLIARRRNGNTTAALQETASVLHVNHVLAKRPNQCSGGERQRASIARALLSNPDALLLDEPFAHLDPALRHLVREEVVRVRHRFGGPIVYVTHDHAEAMSVGDMLAVLIEGRIEDQGDPQRVYDHPATLAVARFLGDRTMNLFVENGVTLGIRPECVELAAEGDVHGRIVARETTGADAFLSVDTQRGRVLARIPAASAAGNGDLVALRFPERAVRRFDTQTGRAIV
ncbi:MAG: ABC transporter ATP-binding protein [Candidatus Eremiobacteraeota bacterium]|nr:ABC transporter ATP-binding protein [Candidatus Eremiobacteraeota bacterium]